MEEIPSDEPYSGVRALFNADLQAVMGFIDRSEWTVESHNVIRYIGATAIVETPFLSDVKE